jgi:electron transfer flavoprotein beta subunit
MNIIVCVKQVLDPEIPFGRLEVDPIAQRVVAPEGIPRIINPYDERAVELALRLKEKHGGKITILSLGGPSWVAIVKHALSMGADDGVIVSDPAFEGTDTFGIASLLSKAIQKIGNYHLILCARQSADWEEGLVGTIIAENLSLPLVTVAEDIEVIEQGLKVKQVTLDGHRIFMVPLPAVVTVSQEVGRPRLPSGWGIINASKKQVPVWDAKAIGMDPSQAGMRAARRELIKLSVPERSRKCEIIQEESGAEAGAKLAERLREAGIL